MLTSLGKTYSHNLKVVVRSGKIGIKCRVLCALTRRRGASKEVVVGIGGECDVKCFFSFQNAEIAVAKIRA